MFHAAERQSLSTEVACEVIAVETTTYFLVVLLREKGGQGHKLVLLSFGPRDENILGDSVYGRRKNSSKQVEGGLKLSSAQEMAGSTLRTWDDDLYYCQEKVTGEAGQKGYFPLTDLNALFEKMDVFGDMAR